MIHGFSYAVEDIAAVAMVVGNKVRVVVEAVDSKFVEATDLHILLTKNCCRVLGRQKWLSKGEIVHTFEKKGEYI